VTKSGKEVLLWLVAPGDSFGMGALLSTPWRYIGTAQAIDECEFLVWSRDRIRSLAAMYELIPQNALRIAAHCLAGYTDRVVGMPAETAEERLAHVLLQLGRQLGQVGENGIEITIMNEELAGLADVSAFTASRQLKEWQRQGIVRKSRGKVFILSPEG